LNAWCGKGADLSSQNYRSARAGRLCAFREGVGQRFVVTIDTEEEFDWTSR
jgi:hypothetical protein